jgi:cytoskeletal protein CcmA (bactofilin family)
MISFFTPYHLKMFGTKSDSQVRNSGVAFPAPSSTSSQSNHRGGAIITDQVELKGSLAFDGNLEFNGHFEGEIISGGTLIIGADAILKGDIQANKVILHGKMHGNISATESIEVCDQAQLFGDVRTEKFIVAESASFRGRSEPLDGKATSPSFIPTFRHLSSKLA